MAGDPLLDEVEENLRWHLPVNEKVISELCQRVRAADLEIGRLEQVWRNADERADRAEAETARLREALLNLKRGACWCEVGIGNPMVRGVHSNACQRALDVVGASRLGEPRT